MRKGKRNGKGIFSFNIARGQRKKTEKEDGKLKKYVFTLMPEPEHIKFIETKRMLLYPLQYKGVWCDDLMHGGGVLSWEDETVFHGVFLKGRQNGHGIYKFKNGDEMEGDFFEGESPSLEIMTLSTTRQSHLDFQDIDTKDIEYRYNNGDIYRGDLKEWIPHG